MSETELETFSSVSEYLLFCVTPGTYTYISVIRLWPFKGAPQKIHFLIAINCLPYARNCNGSILACWISGSDSLCGDIRGIRSSLFLQIHKGNDDWKCRLTNQKWKTLSSTRRHFRYRLPCSCSRGLSSIHCQWFDEV